MNTKPGTRSATPDVKAPSPKHPRVNPSDKDAVPGTPESPPAGEDYRNASGRDHPAESEHDHKRQKLNGESAKMAENPSPSLKRE